MNANIYHRKLFCIRNHFERLLSQCAVDKGIYRRDLQSLHCVFISSDLTLHVGNKFETFLTLGENIHLALFLAITAPASCKFIEKFMLDVFANLILEARLER